MAGMTLTEPRLVSSDNGLIRSMAPDLGRRADAGARQMALQDFNRLESEPSIDDHSRFVRRVGYQRPNRSIARATECAIELTVAYPELVKERLFHPVECEEQPACSDCDTSCDRTLAARRHA